ncbi:MAG: hypothetical protein M1820_001450 [Bogoriella megaspora]|nr:MAG: hypothetical protein M1820_001450 [Bogoriella megaspora]
MPAYLHCIIEGVHLLEDRDNASHTRNLDRTLKILSSLSWSDLKTSQDVHCESSDEVAEPETQRVVKVFFATDGYVDSLAKLVDEGGLEKIRHDDESDQL